MKKSNSNNHHPKPKKLTLSALERLLYTACDILRCNMDASESKHVNLGLIFFKYIFDAFEQQRKKLTAERSKGADPQDPDEYRTAMKREETGWKRGAYAVVFPWGRDKRSQRASD